MSGSTSYELRLDEARVAVEGHYGAWCDEIEARDAIILEAIDEGWPPSKVAAWAGISKGRIVQIVARRGAVGQA